MMMDNIDKYTPKRAIQTFKTRYSPEFKMRASEEQIAEHFNDVEKGYGGKFETAGELVKFFAQAEGVTEAQFCTDCAVDSEKSLKAIQREQYYLPFGAAFKMREGIKGILQGDCFAAIRERVSDKSIDRLFGDVTGKTIDSLDNNPLSKEAVGALFKEQYNSAFENIQQMVHFYGRCQAQVLTNLGEKWEIKSFFKAIAPLENKKLVGSEPARLLEGLHTELNDGEEGRFSCIPDELKSKEAITKLVAFQTTRQKGRLDESCHHIYDAVTSDEIEIEKARAKIHPEALYEEKYPNGFQALLDMVNFRNDCEVVPVDYGVKNLIDRMQAGSVMRLEGDEPQILSDALYDAFADTKYKFMLDNHPEQVNEDRINLLIAQHIDPSSTLSPASAVILSDVHDRIIDGIGFGC